MSLFDMQYVAKSQEIINKVYDVPELKACPIEVTFKLIGKRWTILILREMFRGVTQFNRFHENVKGITSKMLSLRLRELEHNKIVKRKITSEYPVRVEYELTDFGRELAPILLLAASFSMSQLPKVVFKDGKPRDPMELIAKYRRDLVQVARDK
jgi:DNA-binding HxlR family transcriptional regulator